MHAMADMLSGLARARPQLPTDARRLWLGVSSAFRLMNEQTPSPSGKQSLQILVIGDQEKKPFNEKKSR